MSVILLKNGTIINEGSSITGSVLIENEFIKKVLPGVFSESNLKKSVSEQDEKIFIDKIIDCSGLIIMPGLIDDQVHFREPGSTHKGNIESESKAAVLGGVTTYMDMPNNNPPATSNILLENKYNIAKDSSYANYSFYLGASNFNLDELQNIDKDNVCGIKVFMGSSTGNMLVDNDESLNQIFRISGITIATHCEDESIIRSNLENAKKIYGEEIPFSMHNKIRNRESCIVSTKKALDLALTYNTKLHILHISTKEEIDLIREAKKVNNNISAETCVQYMYFNSGDYDTFGSRIKCNPSIKDETDRLAIIRGVQDGIINIVATDHAPHSIEEKNNKYLSCPSGLPLIQHGMQIMMELFKDGYFDLCELVQSMCHSPAITFGIKSRGFIKKGYYADLVILDQNKIDYTSTKKPSYRCGWSPFENTNFSSTVIHTLVNGTMVVENSVLTGNKNSMRIKFNHEK